MKPRGEAIAQLSRYNRILLRGDDYPLAYLRNTVIAPKMLHKGVEALEIGYLLTESRYKYDTFGLFIRLEQVTERGNRPQTMGYNDCL